MSIPTESPDLTARPSRDGVILYRLDVEQYLKMIGAGVFREGDHVELLGGILVDKMTKYERHNFAVEGLAEALRGLLPSDWAVREEKSVVLGDRWRPEPDVAVVLGPRVRYRSESPRAEDILMLAEVADSSYRVDRGAKWRRYASCGVPSYWIVNIDAATIEIHGDPAGEGRSAEYRESRSFGPDDEIPVTIDGREVGRVAAREILP
jgi:Uma2 family endonuclease